MNTSKFSNILLNKSPKRINEVSGKILDVLFTINEFIRELNSIDFCNPLGYILTKSLPPEGLIDSKLKQYGEKVKNFINKVTNKLELNNKSVTADDIEEIRLLLEDVIPDEDIKNIIPGGDNILKVIQTLNDSLVLTNTLLSLNDKKRLIKSFVNRISSLSNPINLTELLLKNQSADLNEKLKDFIRPERFREDLLKLIKMVIKIDKSISSISSIINLINKILKSINVLIKILKVTTKILKALPAPAQFATTGSIVTQSSKVSTSEVQISELENIIDITTDFIKNVLLKQIRKIRREIFILLIGLNQLYENLNACQFFQGDLLLGELQNSISSLNNNIQTLDELFPEIKNEEENQNLNTYKGYNLIILKEETTDNNTSLFRRRIIVTNSQNLIEYEGTPTFTPKDSTLLKEGQFYIDSKHDVNVSDKGNNNLSDDDVNQILSQFGYKSLDELNSENVEVNELIKADVQQNPQKQSLYSFYKTEPNKDIETIKRIIQSVSKTTNSNLLNVRLKRLITSLSKKGYKVEDIYEALKFYYSNNFNIQIINNNIQISNK